MTPQLPNENATAEEIIHDYPMLKSCTYSELSLIKTQTEQDIEDGVGADEDEYLLKAINVLIERIHDGSYIPAEDSEDGGVVAVV